MQTSEHDKFFAYIFSLSEIVQHFILEFFPEEISRHLDLENLSREDTRYVKNDHAELFSDVVWRTTLKKSGENARQVVIALLFEHKSSRPVFPHLQFNEYRQEIWNVDRANGNPLTIVLPVLFYHGREKLNIRPFHEYFKALPESMREHMGDFKIIVIDLSQFSDSQLLKLRLGMLACSMLLMKHAKDRLWLLEQFRFIFQRGEDFLETEEGRKFANHLFVYYSKISELSDEKFRRKIQEEFPKDMATKSMSLYDQIMLRGTTIGKIEGKIEKALEVLVKMLLETNLTDSLIASIAGVREETVAEARKEMRERPNGFDTVLTPEWLENMEKPGASAHRASKA